MSNVSQLKKYNRSYHLLLVAFLLLTVVSFLFGKKTIDIHVHDTFFVTPLHFYFIAIAVLLLVSWLLHQFSRNIFRYQKLVAVHVILIILPTIFLALLPGIYDSQYIDVSSFSLKRFQLLNMGILTAILVFLLAQVLFIINFIAGLILRYRSPH